MKELSLVGVIIVTLVVFSFLVDDYFSGRFFNRVTTSVAITAILAVAQTLVIITRNIDLSVGSIVGVTAYLTGEFVADHPSTPAGGRRSGMAVGIGALLGAFNGFLVAYGQRPGHHRHARHAGHLPQLAGLPRAKRRTITADSLPDWVVDLPTGHVVQRRKPRHPGDVCDRRRAW